MRGPSGEGREQHSPIVELVVDLGGQPDSIAGALEGDVQAREEAKPAWQHGCNTTQVAAERLPGEESAAPSGARELMKQGPNFEVPFGGERDKTEHGVDHPTQEFFPGRPVGIPQLELLNRVGGFPVAVE
jgi:hypothetical protein